MTECPRFTPPSGTRPQRVVEPRCRAFARGGPSRKCAGKASRWLIGLLLVFGAGGAWWGYAQQANERSGDAAQRVDRSAGERPPPGPGRGGPGGRRFSGPNRAQPVSAAGVQRQDIRVTVSAIGSIAAENTALVKAKIEGELLAIHFAEGQFVKAGSLLAELDPRAWRIALAQAEGQLARDQAQLQNARLDLARFHDLLTQDGIAKQQVDTQDALVRQLQGSVQADQAQVDNAKLQLSHTRIVAPISGRVGLKQVDLGNVVRPSDAAGLLSIAQTQPVNVVFAVPDSHLPLIQARLRAGEALEVEAWDRDQKRRLAVGQVASTDNAIDPATGTIKLKAAFANLDNGLFPNQFVNVRLRLSTLQDALAVPGAALLRNTEGSYVYRLNEDKTVSARRVQAGASDGDWVSVRGDLEPGDQVVTEGADRLREGSQVEVIQPPPQRSAGAGAGPTERAAFPDRPSPELAETISPEPRRAGVQPRREQRGRSATAARVAGPG